jgi:hypothetical protein
LALPQSRECKDRERGDSAGLGRRSLERRPGGRRRVRLWRSLRGEKARLLEGSPLTWTTANTSLGRLGGGEGSPALSSIFVLMGECVFCVFTNVAHAETDLDVEN